ncbi:MAG: ribbon-helix-helix protein, CopG family [Anaerolineales bacterium]|nr:ribbon-helix-helix protein, CopG family [Anaerolineales bacterium]
MQNTMHRTQILLELDQHQALTEIAQKEKRSLSDVVREMLRQQLAERKKRNLEVAASALLDDYLNDKALTAFTALDAEDFHA